MKRLFLLALAALPLYAADLTLHWTPPSTLVEDQTVGYVVQHAGDSGLWTNVTFVPVPATSVTLNGFAMGAHQFRLLSTNSVQLVGPPSNVASTNLVWAPAPAILSTTISITSSRVLVTNVMSYTK